MDLAPLVRGLNDTLTTPGEDGKRRNIVDALFAIADAGHDLADALRSHQPDGGSSTGLAKSAK